MVLLGMTDDHSVTKCSVLLFSPSAYSKIKPKSVFVWDSPPEPTEMLRISLLTPFTKSLPFAITYLITQLVDPESE